MSFKSVISGIFGSPQAKSVVAFVITEEQKAIAALRTVKINGVSVYDTVANDIKTIGNASLSNAQKFDQVVENTKPIVAGFLTSGGIKTAVDDTESLVRSFVQMVFNDTKSTKAGSIARAVLSLLGIK